MYGLLPAPGDLVWIRSRRWRVERTRRDQNVVRLDVESRGRTLTLLAPFDRVEPVSSSGRMRRVRRRHGLARLAGIVARCHGIRTVLAAVDSTITILPHQLEPVLAILGGARRLLVADEVGLGKTIQAALAIAEIMRRDGSARVLIAVPSALADQWIDELTHRFGIQCTVIDRRRLDEESRTGARGHNPWRRPGVRIVSLDYIKQDHIIDGLPLEPWDLVVIDEAHIACGDTERHAACDQVARRSRHVLLLTATPHDGDALRFDRLVGLGALTEADPPTVIFRRTRRQLSMQTNRKIRWHHVATSEPVSRLLQALVRYEAAVLEAAGSDLRETALLLLSVFRKRGLSTMAALVVTLERRLAWIERGESEIDDTWIQPRLDFDGDVVGDDEEGPLIRHVGLDTSRERAWLKRLLVLAEAARHHDSKIDRLVRLIRRSPEPVIVFTEFRHSLKAVARRLEDHRSVAVLHGGQTAADRRGELDRFLQGTATVLVATDVASLGLNLQRRARWVINLDLPWNPVRLEQRAGRVDRIGQNRPVHITLMLNRHDAETAVIARLAARTMAARHTLGDDALDVVPSADCIRESVLTSTLSSEPPPVATVSVCREHVRIARAAARVLERRRRLAACWRGPRNHGGAEWVRGRGAAPIKGGNHTVLAFLVPIVDRLGTIVEQHTVAVRVPTLGSAIKPSPAQVAAASLVAARSLVKRAERASRLRHRAFAEAASRERVLAATAVAESLPDEAQPGLFDHRELRARNESRKGAEEACSRLERRIEFLEDSPDVFVGRPSLVLAVGR